MSDPTFLRDQTATLAVLVQHAANHLGIDPMFVEKDFWVTELLRSVSGGATLDVDGTQAAVPVVFKGGTSLSRVFGLIDRFSEDVDLLVVFPDGMGTGTRDRALKQIVEDARIHLHLQESDCFRATSTKGVKRNVGFRYPRRYTHTTAKEHLLLEMGSRGGPNPHATHSLRSMVAEYAIAELGDDESTWPEFAPVTIEVLAPERTLVEKCALLHNLGTKIVNDQDEVALEYMGRAGRHYYDVARLLSDEGVRDALNVLGSDGVAKLAADIDEASENAGWRFEPRPDGGYATSAAFATDASCHNNAAAAYEVAMAMVYGAAPPFAEVLATVREHGHLI